MNTSAVNRTVIKRLQTQTLAYCVNPVQAECTVAMWIWKMVPVILLFLGTFGNILNLFVLSRKSMRAYSISIFLLFLAVSDLAFLYSSVIRMFLLRLSEYDIRNWSLTVCIVQPWMTFLSAGFSAWLLVFVTTERTIFIVWPLNTRRKITRTKAIVISVVLLITVSLFTGHLLFAFEMREVHVEETDTMANETVVIKTTTMCVAEENSLNNFRTGLWQILVMVLMNVIPTLLIFTGDVMAAVALYRQNRKRKSMIGCETSSAIDVKRAAAAKMLMFLCSFFLVATTPHVSFNVIKAVFFRDTDHETFARLQLAHAVTYMLLACNFTFNFWLYFASGSLFKTEWRMMVAPLMTRYTAFVNKLTNTRDNANGVRNQQ